MSAAVRTSIPLPQRRPVAPLTLTRPGHEIEMQPPAWVMSEGAGEFYGVDHGSGMFAPSVAAFSDAFLGNVDVEGRVTLAPSDIAREVAANDLVTEILEYRDLRAKLLSGKVDDDTKERLERLDTYLRAPIDQQNHNGFIRSFRRFDYSFRAQLRTETGEETLTVEVENISAGGVKLALPQPRPEGERVWLILRGHEQTTVILPSRVAWCRDRAVGLMFAGAPSWQR